jgi:hypothetical protein
LLDTQFDQAIGKQDTVSAMNFPRERAEDGADARRIPQNPGSGNDEALSGAQNDRTASGERAGADLWALKVGENGDRFFLSDGGGSEDGDILGVFGVCAMREIQSGYVHAGFQ